MSKTYKHLFFDLDRTLWDLDTSNLETFKDLFLHFRLSEKNIASPTDFYNTYMPINLALWERYKKKEIDQKFLNFSRFHESLIKFGFENTEFAQTMADYYLDQVKRKTLLFPYTHEILEALKVRYQMHIITNGFEELQHFKISNSGLRHYFTHIITSEMAGYKKPDGRIFAYALQQAGANKAESIIIGDDPEADIIGAERFGMDQIWVNHKQEQNSIANLATFTIENLNELRNILA